MKPQFDFQIYWQRSDGGWDPGWDFVTWLERATGHTLGVFESMQSDKETTGDSNSNLSCSGNTVRIRRSAKGHIVLYPLAYHGPSSEPGASIVVFIETGSGQLTAENLADAQSIYSQFNELLNPNPKKPFHAIVKQNRISGTDWQKIVGGPDYPRATPETAESGPLLDLLKIGKKDRVIFWPPSEDSGKRP